METMSLAGFWKMEVWKLEVADVATTTENI